MEIELEETVNVREEYEELMKTARPAVKEFVESGYVKGFDGKTREAALDFISDKAKYAADKQVADWFYEGIDEEIRVFSQPGIVDPYFDEEMAAEYIADFETYLDPNRTPDNWWDNLPEAMRIVDIQEEIESSKEYYLETKMLFCSLLKNYENGIGRHIESNAEKAAFAHHFAISGPGELLNEFHDRLKDKLFENGRTIEDLMKGAYRSDIANQLSNDFLIDNIEMDFELGQKTTECLALKIMADREIKTIDREKLDEIISDIKAGEKIDLGSIDKANLDRDDFER